MDLTIRSGSPLATHTHTHDNRSRAPRGGEAAAEKSLRRLRRVDPTGADVIPFSLNNEPLLEYATSV